MTAILYQNEDRTVTVLDIPTSIAEAQGQSSASRTLLSCEALAQPWPSCEPKSVKARSQLPPVSAETAELHDLLRTALAEVKGNLNGPFCHPRRFHASALVRGKRRRPGDARADGPGAGDDEVQLANWSARAYGLDALDLASDGLSGQGASPSSVDAAELCQRLVKNTSSVQVRLEVQHGDHQSATFLIPPQSSFLLADLLVTYHRHPVYIQAPFDVILMDPPWPNRSVKRGKKSGDAHYHVASSMWELQALLQEVDAKSLLTPGGYVAVWITNKALARELLLKSGDGLFASWDVRLVEEWVWLKVTGDGEPVLPVDGAWRSPYEILLIGQKEAHAGVDELPQTGDEDAVRRRVILAVPDLHSRKPCLKDLLRKALMLPDDYRGLEVFARNVNSGWCAWGNEALKFNDQRHWSSDSTA